VIAPQSRSVQQLAEVLATLVSSPTERAATQGAVERIAECFDSEVGAIVRDGEVVASVGFRQDGPVPAALLQLAAGHGGSLVVPGAGACDAVVVSVPSESPSQLLLARSGGDTYSLEEVSLLRSMGRILANALDGLHLRDVVAASEVRFRRIVETANEGIWLLSVDGTTTFANDKTAEILGYPPEEMIGLSLFDVVDDSGKANAARNLERRRQGLSDHLECAFLRKDKTLVWVLLNASPLLDADGMFVGSLCMVSDISHRKHIEEVLSRREQQLADAQRVAGVGSFELDLATGRASWSDGMFRLLGLDPSMVEPTYDGYLSYVHPEDRAGVDQRIRATIDGAGSHVQEYRIVRGNNQVLWVQGRSETDADEHGEARVMRGTVLDVTASKHTEEALRETTARFQLLQAMATAANEASCLEEVLQVAVDEICAHTGWVAGHAYLPGGAGGGSVVPLPIWHLEDRSLAPLQDAVVPMRPAPASGLVERVLWGRSVSFTSLWTLEGLSPVEQVASDLGLHGALAFPVCVSAEVTCILQFFSRTPMDPSDRLLETIGQLATQLSRVAERQRASNELATARDAAMESSRLKSEFLATMSHEIRTPMNGVIGLTGLLLSTDLDERQRQYAEGVQSAGEALLAIINDILDFSKIEAGRLELEVIDFDLVQVVEEAMALVASAAQRKGLELVASCATDLPSGVRGDPARLRQILLNLASNAVKFTLEGEVVVRAKVQDDGGDSVTVRFEVTDTGIGISEGDGRRLFEPFSQADASTTRRFGGTGLGLVISRRLVAAMGGEMGFESTVGMGSTFWFTLPLRRQAGAFAAPGPAPAGVRVLVVDDNETSRLTLQDQLGAGADVAADAIAALAMLQPAAGAGRPYDVALVDSLMPGMDGAELVRRVVADPALAATRLVMLTSAAALGRPGPGCPPDLPCITKPVRVSQLADVLGHPSSPSRGSTFPVVAPADTRGHILVVEDNASNQLVAVGILRLLGYRADVASDGREALDALGRAEFDAILMDCQMPEMDGFEATREIRGREGPHRHTPVIAMTAGASESDRDQCLAAGMDDFLTKPVKPREIDAMLAKWVVPGAEPAPEPALDHEILEELRQLTPDGSLLAEVVETYLGAAPDHVAELMAAAAGGDPGPVRQCAHRLRGESSAIGAVEVASLCRTLEEQAVAGRVDGAPALASAIEAAFGRAAGELRNFMGQRAGAR
jgi:two-component system sensor histidine kinase/response regulator